KSVKEMQMGLIFNGLLKVPMQFFILLVGVMVFVFYQFNQSPINFNPAAEQVMIDSEYSGAYQDLENEQLAIFNSKQEHINKIGKSVKDMQMVLIFNGLLKVPMQFFILLVGVMVFVFYQFNLSPINFNPAAEQVMIDSEYSGAYQDLENEQLAIFNSKQEHIN